MRSAVPLAICVSVFLGCCRLAAAEDFAASPLDDLGRIAAEAEAKPDPTPKPDAATPAACRWRVVSVHDGDTVLCLDDDSGQHKVRLLGIDAPEIGQPFSTVSRDSLRALVLRKTVTVRSHGEDRYGRTLATLEIEGDDVARRMVTDGLAWHYARYSDDEALAAAEREARAARRGLWADREPLPPWEWRATERARKDAERERVGR